MLLISLMVLKKAPFRPMPGHLEQSPGAPQLSVSALQGPLSSEIASTDTNSLLSVHLTPS
ncbi:hypothetical protein AN958_00256 [Leucoagaricus sp. SymC.cos]|nr:hypothetical protein AN958_00256 [Leucoagaricus sp. SymC.cos]